MIGESWKLIFRNAGIDILRKLFYAVRKSFKSCRSNKKHKNDCIWWSSDIFNQNATPLHVAAAYGDFKFFNRIMDMSEVGNPKTEELETLLYVATIKGNFRISRFLLSTLEKKNPSDDMGWTGLSVNNPKTKELLKILVVVAEKGNIKIFKVLLRTLEDKNPVINCRSTLLHIAAKHGHWKICQLIIKNIKEDKNLEAKNPNPANYFGWTVLHIAAEHGHLKICQLIMKNIEGDKNPRNTNPISDRTTPLHIASELGHVKVCKLFMDYLKDKSYEEKNPLEMGTGRAPFALAMKNDHLEVCKLILEYFDDKNPRTRFAYSSTVFHDAAYSDYDVCELIMNEFKAAGIKNKNPANNDGVTPLHNAASNGIVNICKLIIDNVQDKCPIAENGITPLHWSAMYGHSELCELFLQNITKEEASIQCNMCYVCFACKQTTLKYTSLKDELKTKPEFLAHYASDHEGVDPRGMTPYEYAVYKLRYYYESYGHTYTKKLYRTLEIFRKYLEIPETDPITGEIIFYLKYLEEPEAKKIKFGLE